MSRTFSLGEKERLKSRKAIDRLFTQGKKFVVTPWRVFYFMEKGKGSESLMFGTGVSTRNFKRAVDRNRIKRLSREGWRLQKATVRQRLIEDGVQLHVFVIFTGREVPEFEDVFKSMGNVVQRLEKIISS